MANSAQTITASLPETGGAPRFECQFVYTSTSVCTLNRCNGSRLFINGLNEQIPSTAPTLSNSGLASNDTTYYVYAYMSGGTMTLEASATAYATDSTYGHKIKSGDATRTLVGMVRKTGGNFVWSETNRFVATYFNRVRRSLSTAFSVLRTTTSTTAVEINSEIRQGYLVWADELVDIATHAYAYTSAPGYVYHYPGTDGTTALSTYKIGTGYDSSTHGSAGASRSVGYAAEGYHYNTFVGSVSGAFTGNYLNGFMNAAIG